jgi:hypothetical protein
MQGGSAGAGGIARQAVNTSVALVLTSRRLTVMQGAAIPPGFIGEAMNSGCSVNPSKVISFS